MSRLTRSLIDTFSKIPEWLLEQQDAYNADRQRTSPHTRGRAVSARVAAKRRLAAKKRRQQAKKSRLLNRQRRMAKAKKRKKRKAKQRKRGLRK